MNMNSKYFMILPSLAIILPGLIGVSTYSPSFFSPRGLINPLRSAATVKAEAAQLRLEMDELTQRHLDQRKLVGKNGSWFRFSWGCSMRVKSCIFVTLNFAWYSY